MNRGSESSSLPNARRRLGGLLVLSALALTSACGDDDGDGNGAIGTLDGSVSDAGIDSSTPAQNGDGGIPDGGSVILPPPANAIYAISTWVTAGTTTSAYTKLVARLDTDSKVDIKTDSIESGGYGDLKVFDGKIFVNDGEAPTVTNYTVDTSGKLIKDKTVNFMQYSTASAMYRQAIVSPTVAYLTGDTSWVRWNPSTMAIDPGKNIAFPTTVAARDGIQPFYAFDRGFAVRGNRLYQSIYWVDFTNYKMTATSAIAVIDTETSALVTVLDAPCPGLDSATTDDAGNIYFSGWSYNPGATIVNKAPKGCAVKIPAGSDTIDPTFSLTFADVTGGHEAIGMRHISGNKFLVATFHEEKTPYNAATDKIGDWLFADSWLFATYDILTKEYKELPALGYHSGGYYSERIGNQFFLLVRKGATTEYVELLADGTGKKGIEVDGWATRAYRVR